MTVGAIKASPKVIGLPGSWSFKERPLCLITLKVGNFLALSVAERTISLYFRMNQQHEAELEGKTQ